MTLKIKNDMGVKCPRIFDLVNFEVYSTSFICAVLMQNINTVVFALVQENGIRSAFILSGPAVSLSRCCNCYYIPQSSFTQHGFMLHGLNCRFQTVSLCHHLCLEGIMKPRVVSTGIISNELKWELLMLLMDSFYI